MTVVGPVAHHAPRWWRYSPLHRRRVRLDRERRLMSALKYLIHDARGGDVFISLDDLSFASRHLDGLADYEIVPYGDKGDEIAGYRFTTSYVALGNGVRSPRPHTVWP